MNSWALRNTNQVTRRRRQRPNPAPFGLHSFFTSRSPELHDTWQCTSLLVNYGDLRPFLRFAHARRKLNVPCITSFLLPAAVIVRAQMLILISDVPSKCGYFTILAPCMPANKFVMPTSLLLSILGLFPVCGRMLQVLGVLQLVPAPRWQCADRRTSWSASDCLSSALRPTFIDFRHTMS